MNTVITHFYNEEYLLPWWINHHKKLFDYGIMINYNSTDRSVEICKKLCPPNWKIVDTVNHYFDAKSNDAEVKMYENTVEGFKMALTTTEFLLVPNSLDHLANFMTSKSINYVGTVGVCMVDTSPDDMPTYDRSLIEQKHNGMIKGYHNPDIKNCLQMAPNSYDPYYIIYGRYFHNKPFGNYLDGRHYLNNVGDDKIFLCPEIYILKYKFAPWNEFNIRRLYAYVDKLKENNNNINIPPVDEMTYFYEHFLTTAHDLNDDVDFKKAFDYCMGL